MIMISAELKPDYKHLERYSEVDLCFTSSYNLINMAAKKLMWQEKANTAVESCPELVLNIMNQPDNIENRKDPIFIVEEISQQFLERLGFVREEGEDYPTFSFLTGGRTTFHFYVDVNYSKKKARDGKRYINAALNREYYAGPLYNHDRSLKPEILKICPEEIPNFLDGTDEPENRTRIEKICNRMANMWYELWYRFSDSAPGSVGSTRRNSGSDASSSAGGSVQ